MASEKNGALHNEQPMKRSKGQRMSSCCARFWWVLVIILIVVVLVTVLPIIFLAYPKMARGQVADSKLEVVSMSIKNPQPNSVELAFEQIFLSNSSYHPTLYPFNASFYLTDKKDNPPFASIRTPEIVAANGTQSQVPLQRVNITHMDEFTRYVLVALQSKNFSIALRGTGDLEVSALPKTAVNYDQSVTLKGFDNLSGFNLQSFKVMNGTDPDGVNSIGMSLIYNPTIMTLDLGKIMLNLTCDGTPIGIGIIEDLVLAPGLNSVTMRIISYELVVVGIVLTRRNAVIPVEIRGINSSTNGQLIPYFTTMIQNTLLKADVNITLAIEGTNLTSRSLELLR